MADHPEMIRRQMEGTRAALAEKLEALETQVSNTVESTTEAVAETVEAVKDTVENVTEAVQETVQNVAETFNVKRHVERYPWVTLGGAVAVGCLAGYLIGGPARKRGQGRGEGEAEAPRTSSRPSSASSERTNGGETERSPASSPANARTSSEQNGEGQKSWFWQELGRLKSLGIGVLMGAVRDLAFRSLPETVGQRVAEEVDHVTTGLGGEPIHGSVLSSHP